MNASWVWAALATSAGLLVGVAAAAMTRRALSAPRRRPALREIAGPAATFVFGVLTATGLVFAVAVASPETLEPLPRDILDWMPHLAVAGLVLIGGYAVGLMAGAAVAASVARASGRRRRGIERAVHGLVLAGAGVLALEQVGVETTMLQILVAVVTGGTALAVAGMATIGSREIAADIAAGRVLQAHLSGAVIRCDLVAGRVVDLGPSHAVVEGTDGVRRLVPYSRLAREVIELRTGDTPA